MGEPNIAIDQYGNKGQKVKSLLSTIKDLKLQSTSVFILLFSNFTQVCDKSESDLLKMTDNLFVFCLVSQFRKGQKLLVTVIAL